MPTSDLTRRRLTARLAELNAMIDRIEDEQRQPLDDDFAEQVVVREDDETLDAVERSALAEAALTRRALVRLNAGVYGLCLSCGQPVAAHRLEAMPATPYCIRCASERGGT